MQKVNFGEFIAELLIAQIFALFIIGGLIR